MSPGRDRRRDVAHDGFVGDVSISFSDHHGHHKSNAYGHGDCYSHSSNSLPPNGDGGLSPTL
jgi:predicted heme/steroid binding protein